MMSTSVAKADLFEARWSTNGSFADTSPVTFAGVSKAGSLREGHYMMNMLLGTIEFQEDESLSSSGIFALTITLDDVRGGIQTFAYVANYLVEPQRRNGSGPNDRLLIDFPDPVLVTIAGPSPTFRLAIPDVDVVRNGHRTRSFDLAGYITAEPAHSTTAIVSAVPEPESVVLLASVICGVVVLQRKRLFTVERGHTREPASPI